MRSLFARAIRVAGNARFVQSVPAELVEQGRGEGTLIGDGRADFHGFAMSVLHCVALKPQMHVDEYGLEPAPGLTCQLQL